MAEIATISARKSALQKLAEEGSKGAAAALKLKEDPPRLLATTQIVLNLVGVLSAVLTAFAVPVGE